MPEVREFRLPDLGEGLTEAEIVRWLVAVGDIVTVDQPVLEVETAKAQVEVPCPYAGVVTSRHGEEGQQIPVGTPLITIASAPVPDGAPGSSGSSGTSGNVLVGYGTAATAAPAVRRRRTPPLTGTVPLTSGRPAPAAGPTAVISPLVRRLARERGIDLHTLRGSGPGGLILRADLDRATRPEPGPEPAAATRIPLRGTAGAAAAKLTRSRAEIPDATCWVDADATELLAARQALGEPRISLLALLARICIAALATHPRLNASVDTAAREIVVHPDIHLSLATQTDRGLLVPVVRNAGTRTLQQLHDEIGRLTEAARTGRLTPADLTGGTFTLNNYGVFGVDGSTPIINHPEAAMLGVGRIAEKPWAHQGRLALRQVVQLSLTFDHRVCDGGTAGGFLREVADTIESPARLLRHLRPAAISGAHHP
ncbi:dihydrolipoamide acetyltransferase family protein [Streptomyces aidingensis]|uniref:Dihydrolipoamide acetyltransferase component of pyruvate dehydrogenase complex n=1 Tax=Streptomyces aidingensis TaxID=910347 RepID=A0A1I1R1C7_9ACTN|nr:dihydrolipoamide acetyltransferase family protein [Streptomyces aidingensis]SFD24070.1 pyruvate dehydrogenase E2 component (dihydrolipoamide acetyltransferase) [Streptomyces aidingensis]